MAVLKWSSVTVWYGIDLALIFYLASHLEPFICFFHQARHYFKLVKQEIDRHQASTDTPIQLKAEGEPSKCHVQPG